MPLSAEVGGNEIVDGGSDGDEKAIKPTGIPVEVPINVVGMYCTRTVLHHPFSYPSFKKKKMIYGSCGCRYPGAQELTLG